MTLFRTSLPIFLFCLALSEPAISASFDCKKAKSEIEVKICSDEYLSTLDSALSRVYKAALNSANNKTELKQNQKNWLKSRMIKDDIYLTGQYESRIFNLIGKYGYELKFGGDYLENILISIMITNYVYIKPDDNLARLQTKSLKLSKSSGFTAFPIISGNRESEYKFIFYKEGSYSKMQIPTFDLETKTIINSETISGVVTIKDGIIEVLSGSGNHGGKIFTFKIEDNNLVLTKQESFSAAREGKEVTTTEYKK